MFKSSEAIFNDWFFLAYLFLLFVAFLVYCEVYIRKRNITGLQNVLLYIFGGIFICLFGLRKFDVGVDTAMYVGIYSLIETLKYNEPGFNLYNMVFHRLGASPSVFIFSISFIYIIFIILFLRRKNYRNIFLVFFCWVSLFFFKSMGINTVRQGLASSILLLGFTFDKAYIRYLFFLIAATFHSSMAIVLGVYFVSGFLTQNIYGIAAFVLGFILSIINVPIYTWLSQIPGINLIVKDKLDFYQNVDKSDYKIGFRPDFFVFNLLFAIIGIFTVRNFKKYISVEYARIVNIYLFLSSFFFIMFNSGFSDRYGFLSWMFIPMIIAPYLDNAQQFKSKFLNKNTILLIVLALAVIFYKLKTEA